MRKTDARVARRALDDGAARLQRAAQLGIANDVERRAILHRSARIHEFRLAQDLAARFRAELRQPDKRCATHAVDEALSHVHAPLLCHRARAPYTTKDRTRPPLSAPAAAY